MLRTVALCSMNIHPVIMSYPGAQYATKELPYRYEEQMPYPEWYKDEFKFGVDMGGVIGMSYDEASKNKESLDEWEKKATAIWNWRNHDLRMILWFERYFIYTQGKEFVMHSHFLFLEPDVLVQKNAIEKLSKSLADHIHFGVPRAFDRMQIPSWPYWNDASKFGDSLSIDLWRSGLVCVPPLACILISKEAMFDMLWYKQNTQIFEWDIFSELRLPTLMNYAGYAPQVVPMFDGVRCFPKPLLTEKTPFYHPYKIKP